MGKNAKVGLEEAAVHTAGGAKTIRKGGERTVSMAEGRMTNRSPGREIGQFSIRNER